MKIPGFILRMAGRWIATELKLKEGKDMDKKKWYQSKTVWSGILAVLVGTYNLVATNVAPTLDFTLPAIPDWIFTILGAMGIYGRVSADKKIV